MTPVAVICTVLGYIAVLFAVAWLSGRRADNAGFFTGNRRTPWYMAAFAMIGAAMSGVTFISVPGSVAADSFSYMQMVAGFTVGQFVVAYVLIPTFYRLRVVSLYEYLDDRFGVASHRTGAWFFFISKMLGAALRVYVVCAVLQVLVFAHYGIPFYVLGPTSTIDMRCPSGDAITIEERPSEEITEMWYTERMAPAGVKTYNPAFDVTPADLITAIITEKGIARAPYNEVFESWFM